MTVAVHARPFSRLAHPREVVRQFTPNWFTVTMGTGITALMLANLPFAKAAFHGIGAGLWLANVVLFALASALFVARGVFFPETFARIFTHATQSLFLGAIPMGLATIVNGFGVFGVPLLGATAVRIAYPLWWIDAALAVACGLAVPYLMFTRQSHAMTSMTAMWLLPIVACEVSAASGGLLAPRLALADARVVETASLVLWAFSVPMALGILAILFMRLALHSVPPSELAVSGWLTLGPLGTGALGMVLLGKNVGALAAGTALAPLALSFHAVTLVVAFVLWGYGAWWWALAIAMTLHHAVAGLPFNMGWWAFVFPLGVYAASTYAIGGDTGMTFFSGLGAALTLMLGALWLLVAARTAHGAWEGHLFKAPCLAEQPKPA